MRDLHGRTVFITGGASGIGLALGRVFSEAGMNVMLADIESEALSTAVEGMMPFGERIRGVVCDVADPASVERAAKDTFEAFGNVSRAMQQRGSCC